MVPSVLLALKLARTLGVSVDKIFSLDGGSETARLHSRIKELDA
jgi:DNA-binding XRE family transcriptional regulator